MVCSLLPLIHRPALAYDGSAAKVPSRVVAPDIRWARLGNRVAVLCDECDLKAGKPPRWLLTLGSRLHGQGLEAVPVRSGSPGDFTQEKGFVAILDGRQPPPTGESGRTVPTLPFQVPPDTGEIRQLAQELDTALSGDRADPSPVRYLFIVHPDSDAGHILHAQASWVAHYAKLDAEFIQASDLDRFPTPRLRRYSAVAIATEAVPRTLAARLARSLEDYLAHGGGVVSLGGVYDDDLRAVFGVGKMGKAHRIRAISCDGSWFPGAQGLEFLLSGDMEVSLPRMTITPGQRVLCEGRTADGSRIPISYTSSAGKGRVVYWHGGQLADKSSRGLILLSLMEAAAPSAAAVLDALVFWVDDCPMPMWNAKLPPLDTLYDMTDVEFYERMWWPRMKAFFERYRLKPSFGFILSYDDRTVSGFASMYKGDDDPATRLARSIVADGFEVSLHGYNHQSLTVARKLQSRGWPGRAEMTSALRLARSEMQTILGPDRTTTSYVAPNNLIQKMGKESVIEVFPEITVMASQYLDEEAIMGQEFGPDPDLPGITDIPRISSEHFLDGRNAHELLNALALPGVLSHFIHPDDIRDPERSRNMNFDQMMSELESLMDRVLKAYPFLRKVTATQFGRRVEAHGKASLEVRRAGDSLQLTARGAPAEGLTTFVRLPRDAKPRAGANCHEVFRAPDQGRYYYRVGEEPCIIGL